MKIERLDFFAGITKTLCVEEILKAQPAMYTPETEQSVIEMGWKETGKLITRLRLNCWD